MQKNLMAVKQIPSNLRYQNFDEIVCELQSFKWVNFCVSRNWKKMKFLVIKDLNLKV